MAERLATIEPALKDYASTVIEGRCRLITAIAEAYRLKMTEYHKKLGFKAWAGYVQAARLQHGLEVKTVLQHCSAYAFVEKYGMDLHLFSTVIDEQAHHLSLLAKIVDERLVKNKREASRWMEIFRHCSATDIRKAICRAEQSQREGRARCQLGL